MDNNFMTFFFLQQYSVGECFYLFIFMKSFSKLSIQSLVIYGPPEEVTAVFS